MNWLFLTLILYNLFEGSLTGVGISTASWLVCRFLAAVFRRAAEIDAEERLKEEQEQFNLKEEANHVG